MLIFPPFTSGEYHCWLQMDTTLMIAQYVPIVVLAILTLTLIEAAGAAEYRKLPGIDQRQQTSAKIMQRSNLIIMPMVFISFMTAATIAAMSSADAMAASLVDGVGSPRLRYHVRSFSLRLEPPKGCGVAVALKTCVCP